MAKFHINQSTGKVARCVATVQECPIGGEHFDSKEAAYAGRENSLEKLHGNFASVFKSTEKEFKVGEVVRLSGDYYDTYGGDATVIEVTEDSVRLQSYDDGEGYTVYKEDLLDAGSQMAVSRNDDSGRRPPKPDTFTVDRGRTRSMKEGESQAVRDSSGEARGTVTYSDGFYRLEAHDAKTGEEVEFDRTLFAQKEKAAYHLAEWLRLNTAVKTTV
jgi:hypothetical protein